MLQLVLTGVLYLILVIPVGRYLYHIAAGKHTFADPVLDRIDDVIYKAWSRRWPSTPSSVS